MRYFFYTNTSHKELTVVMINESANSVTLFPYRGTGNYSLNKDDWMNYYARMKEDHHELMFEICENQAKKFTEQGIMPQNWDW